MEYDQQEEFFAMEDYARSLNGRNRSNNSQRRFDQPAQGSAQIRGSLMKNQDHEMKHIPHNLKNLTSFANDSYIRTSAHIQPVHMNTR